MDPEGTDSYFFGGGGDEMGEIHYRIRITQDEVQVLNKKAYQRVADTGNEKDDGAVYKYVGYQEEDLVETEMLDMRVATLDIQQVVDAIFGRYDG